VYGNFNNYVIDDSTLINFDYDAKAYRGKILLKQGFHNFKYITKDKNGVIDEGAISGNFDETENEYIVLVYYRAPSDLYDRVIGVGSANSRDITN